MEVSEFQKLIRNLYENRDRNRGLEKTALWLVEEVGELAEAVRKGDTNSAKEEIADVIAWTVSIANLMNIDVEEALKEKYPGKCPRCWTEKILKSKGVNPKVVAEITAREWGIFSGLGDVLSLLEGKKVDVYAMPEGSIFYPNEPVIVIEGKYLEFARFETSILGFICHSSGVSRAAFKAKFAAKDKKVLSFGTRRQHPALAAAIERSAYIGGVDGVSNFSAEKYLGINSVGTMPHALVICFGNQVDAWKAFDEVVDEDVPRIMLVDKKGRHKSYSRRNQVGAVVEG